MQFGRKAGTITQQRVGGAEWPRSLRPGETRVRFLAEISDWQEYWEHFDETVKFFPCTEDRSTCPGCTSPYERTRNRSKKYLMPVLDPKTGRVWGLKIGSELANRLSMRADRNGGTITSRDYTLIRTGTGLETEYDVEQEEKVAIDLSVYANSLDVEEMLASQFAAAWPDFDPDNPSANGKAQAAPAPRKRGPGRPRKEAPPPEPEPEPVKDQEGSNDDPPSEAPAPVAKVEEAEGDVMELTEDDLRKMPRPELIKLARQAELPITLTMSREQIVEMFLEQFAAE